MVPVASCNMIWASALAFACILLVLGILLSIPFCLSRLRGVHPAVDLLMDKLASAMGATPPRSQHAGGKRPASKRLLRSLKVTRYKRPDDVEAATTDCCAICCCEYEANDAIVKLECSHFFHQACIVAWLKVDAVCPICKTELMPTAPTAKEPRCTCPSSQPAPVSPSTTGAAAATPTEAQTAAPAPAGPAAAVPGVPVGTCIHCSSLAPSQSPSSPSAPATATRAAVLAPLHLHTLGAPMAGVPGVSP